MANNNKRQGDLIRPLLVKPGDKLNLQHDFDPAYTADYLDKESATEQLQKDIQSLAQWQDRLYAEGKQAVLLVIQAMDAAGKDGAVKHVMSGVNPQGTQVHSFKQPSAEELAHDFLWRCNDKLPERGRIGIFNRSYYEDVLVVRVHPELLGHQGIDPALAADKAFWAARYDSINQWEKHLCANGVRIIKVFLNVSRGEQKKRLQERLDNPEKNWKFSMADVAERRHWDDYMAAYEQMLEKTSTEWAPWYVVPADNKWFSRLMVSSLLVKTLREIDPHYPVLSAEQLAQLDDARIALQNED